MNRDTIKDLTLMLMYLTSWEEGLVPGLRKKPDRAGIYPKVRLCWKGYDFGILNELTDEGVVSADTARAYKPRREIFDEALRVSKCAPGEVVHIGDSYDTDVVGARSAGIRPVLLLRGRTQQHDEVDAVDGLEQALELVFKKAKITTGCMNGGKYR